MSKAERVLIVGGGFGGVKAALELADDEHFDITLLSNDVDFRYYPTLYHTATGGHRDNSSLALDKLFEGQSVKLALGTAQTVDRKAKTVTTTDGQIFDYDTLVIGLGVVTTYFGIDGLADYAYGIKSQTEVTRFKTHLHRQLIDEHQPDLNYVIIGGGPTGIELVGALPLYLKHIMHNHGLPERKVHIDLIEAAPRLLPRLPKATSRTVARRLRRLGVKLYLGSVVQAAKDGELVVNGKPIRSHTVVWTAGVANHPFFADNKFALTNRGKVSVDVYLRAEDNIFVIGDNANTPYSGMAQTALHDGVFVAQNLKRQARGKKFKSYVAKSPITIIPAGPRWATFVWGRLHFHGWRGYLVSQAAELVGFHDLEPWPKAAKQWFSEFTTQDNCEVCAAAQAK